MRDGESAICQLCGRRVPRAVITDHHLVPREVGGGPDDRVPMCRPCHGHLHALFDNKTLAADLSTVEALRRDPRVRKFVRFIRKQDPAARFTSALSPAHPEHRRKRRRR